MTQDRAVEIADDIMYEHLRRRSYNITRYAITEALTAAREEGRRERLEEADAQIAQLRQALGHVVRAWDRLPEGVYTPGELERWLVRHMKPAIDAARAIADKEPAP